jgi:hypothetical protein
MPSRTGSTARSRRQTRSTGALWAANNGGALLKALRDKEQGT